MKFWDEKKSFYFDENIVEKRHGAAVLVLGIKAQINTNEYQESAKIMIIWEVVMKRMKLPVNIVECEGFWEEDERENNTERLPKSGDCHSKKGSKLSDQAQDNLKSNLELSSNDKVLHYLNTEIACEREYKSIAICVFWIVGAVVDGRCNVCEDGNQEE